jgi:proteasome accessory factor B
MRVMKRAARLARIKELLEGRAGGYTTRELADLLEIHQRTIQRDLVDLQSELYVPLEETHGRWRVPKPERLQPLHLTLDEARALLVATRLFLRHSDHGDPDASGALTALARIMPQEVRRFVEAAAETIDRRQIDPDFARHISTVTRAWARRRVLRLSYRSAGKRRPAEVIVEPYFIEPSAAGYAVYLIAYSRTHRQIRTFKVERIVAAELLPEAFVLPDDFDIETLLKSAWGIVWGEGVHVRLRFSSEVAWRVKESRWHPTQQVVDLPDGGLELTMSVASMMELGRWVRSWGDKVEVLAPPDLRAELRQEALRLARLYSRPSKPQRRKASRKRQPQSPPDEQAALPA